MTDSGTNRSKKSYSEEFYNSSDSFFTYRLFAVFYMPHSNTQPPCLDLRARIFQCERQHHCRARGKQCF